MLIFSMLFFMVLVATISYWYTRGTIDSADGFFLAGRSLGGTFIAGSLLLTNISAEQLIGLAGSAYAFNLSSMAWEVTAVVAIMISALILLPRYLASGMRTLPEFLGARFSSNIRTTISIIFLLAYGLITIPSVLYSGSVALLQIFFEDVDRVSSFVFTVVAVAVIGTVYANLGGLRAVAISDTINGIGLLFFGFLIPVLALRSIGEGSVTEGWILLTNVYPEKLNAIGSEADPTPFLTIFTGMLFANLSYWGTNQYVIQRTLAAKSLAAGQKGVLVAGFFKLLIPFFVMVPGITAFHIYGDSLGTMDAAYPALVKEVLPNYLIGLFLAVLLGTVFSSFNSLLQSSATIVSLDLYKPGKASHVTDRDRIKVGQYTGLALMLLGICIAPLLLDAPEGLWQVIRKFSGFYNIPVVAIVIAAIFLKGASTKGVWSVLLFHLPAYTVITFIWDSGIHFVHWYGILFLIEISLLLIMRDHTQRTTVSRSTEVDLTPWRGRWPTVLALCFGILILYVLLSPLGIAR